MEDVAADGDDQALDATLVAADGERIEQGLGRMLMAAVAGIDDRAIDLLRQQLDRTRGVVAHHQNVGAHGVERHRRVDQGLALLHRRGADRHVHHVGAQPLAGKLEGALGPGRGLEEQIDQGAAAEIVALLGDLAAELGGFLGEIEQSDDLGPRKAFNSKKMAVGEGDDRRLRRQCSLTGTVYAEFLEAASSRPGITCRIVRRGERRNASEIRCNQAVPWAACPRVARK